MTRWLDQKRVDRLVRQIGDVGFTPKKDPASVLNPTEQRFFRAAMSKHKAKLWRSGWPDFLGHTEKLGYVAVEVKAGNDKVRPNQAAMFEAFEAAGIKVFVWHPSSPEALVPWRKFAGCPSSPDGSGTSFHGVTRSRPNQAGD